MAINRSRRQTSSVSSTAGPVALDFNDPWTVPSSSTLATLRSRQISPAYSPTSRAISFSLLSPILQPLPLVSGRHPHPDTDTKPEPLTVAAARSLRPSDEVISPRPSEDITTKGWLKRLPSTTMTHVSCIPKPSDAQSSFIPPAFAHKVMRREFTSNPRNTVWYESCAAGPIGGPPSNADISPGELHVHFHRGGHQLWFKDITGGWKRATENQRHPLDPSSVLHIRPSGEPFWTMLG